MLRPALALLLLTTVASQADECDGLASRVAEAIGAKVGRRTGSSVDIRVPGGLRLDLTCRADPIVQAASAEPTPSAAYFADLALAARIVLGESAGAVESAIATAHATALRERRKSFVQQNGWSASCYTDSGGTIRTLCSVGRIPTP